MNCGKIPHMTKHTQIQNRDSSITLAAKDFHFYGILET